VIRGGTKGARLSGALSAVKDDVIFNYDQRVMERSMRKLPTAGGAIALFAALSVTPAISQQMDGFGHVTPEKHGVVEYHQPARNDKAYKSALDQIPDAKAKYDPWGQVRQSPSNSAPK